MDVVVTRATGSGEVWSLTDRLGRKVGQITRSGENQFVIAIADTGRQASLAKADTMQPSLEAAMDEVAKYLRGTCQFASAEDGPPTRGH